MLSFQTIKSAETVEFLSGFLCDTFVEPETKEFVISNNDDNKTWIFCIHYHLRTKYKPMKNFRNMFLRLNGSCMPKTS